LTSKKKQKNSIICFIFQFAFHGETRDIVDHFESIGIPVPLGYNPADFISKNGLYFKKIKIFM
jgi:hypothetical protein